MLINLIMLIKINTPTQIYIWTGIIS